MKIQNQFVGALWTLAGGLMVVSFLLPLFDGLLYQVNGFELADLVRNLDNDKLQAIDPVTGILMLVVSVAAVLLGFWGAICGLMRVAGKWPATLGWVRLGSVVNLLLGIFVAISLENQGGGFVDAFLPKAAVGFYLIMVGEVLIAGSDIVMVLLEKAK